MMPKDDALNIDAEAKRLLKQGWRPYRRKNTITLKKGHKEKGFSIPFSDGILQAMEGYAAPDQEDSSDTSSKVAKPKAAKGVAGAKVETITLDEAIKETQHKTAQAQILELPVGPKFDVVDVINSPRGRLQNFFPKTWQWTWYMLYRATGFQSSFEAFIESIMALYFKSKGMYLAVVYIPGLAALTPEEASHIHILRPVVSLTKESASDIEMDAHKDSPSASEREAVKTPEGESSEEEPGLVAAESHEPKKKEGVATTKLKK